MFFRPQLAAPQAEDVFCWRRSATQQLLQGGDEAAILLRQGEAETDMLRIAPVCAGEDQKAPAQQLLIKLLRVPTQTHEEEIALAFRRLAAQR